MVKIQSKKPTKQRNALRDLAHHQASAVFTVPLEVALQEEHGIKRLPLRKEDSVKVIAGEFVNIEGKVLTINKKTRTVTIEEVNREKKDGSNVNVPISISKLVLTKFGGKKLDPWRQKVIDRKQKLEEVSPTGPKKQVKKDGK